MPTIKFNSQLAETHCKVSVHALSANGKLSGQEKSGSFPKAYQLTVITQKSLLENRHTCIIQIHPKPFCDIFLAHTAIIA